MTVKLSARSRANFGIGPNARLQNAPSTRITGGPSPTRSNAMVVPSLEVSVFMVSTSDLGVFYVRSGFGRLPLRPPHVRGASRTEILGLALQLFAQRLPAYDGVGRGVLGREVGEIDHLTDLDLHVAKH